MMKGIKYVCKYTLDVSSQDVYIHSTRSIVNTRPGDKASGRSIYKFLQQIVYTLTVALVISCSTPETISRYQEHDKKEQSAQDTTRNDIQDTTKIRHTVINDTTFETKIIRHTVVQNQHQAHSLQEESKQSEASVQDSLTPELMKMALKGFRFAYITAIVIALVFLSIMVLGLIIIIRLIKKG